MRLFYPSPFAIIYTMYMFIVIYIIEILRAIGDTLRVANELAGGLVNVRSTKIERYESWFMLVKGLWLCLRELSTPLCHNFHK